MISVVSIASFDEYAVAHALVDAMAQWDAEETAGLGYSREALLAEVHDYTPERLMDKYSRSGTGFYLAYLDGRPAGCVAFVGGGEIGEVHKLFVDPQARGRGIAGKLLTAALDELCRLGCRAARLETATFMTAAIALYQKHGFRLCPPFSPAPAGLDEITLYLERDL